MRGGIGGNKRARRRGPGEAEGSAADAVAAAARLGACPRPPLCRQVDPRVALAVDQGPQRLRRRGPGEDLGVIFSFFSRFGDLRVGGGAGRLEELGRGAAVSPGRSSSAAAANADAAAGEARGSGRRQWLLLLLFFLSFLLLRPLPFPGTPHDRKPPAPPFGQQAPAPVRRRRTRFSSPSASGGVAATRTAAAAAPVLEPAQRPVDPHRRAPLPHRVLVPRGHAPQQVPRQRQRGGQLPLDLEPHVGARRQLPGQTAPALSPRGLGRAGHGRGEDAGGGRVARGGGLVERGPARAGGRRGEGEVSFVGVRVEVVAVAEVFLRRRERAAHSPSSVLLFFPLGRLVKRRRRQAQGRVEQSPHDLGAARGGCHVEHRRAAGVDGQPLPRRRPQSQREARAERGVSGEGGAVGGVWEGGAGQAGRGGGRRTLVLLGAPFSVAFGSVKKLVTVVVDVLVWCDWRANDERVLAALSCCS